MPGPRVRLARDCPTLVIHGPPGTGRARRSPTSSATISPAAARARRQRQAHRARRRRQPSPSPGHGKPVWRRARSAARSARALSRHPPAARRPPRNHHPPAGRPATRADPTPSCQRLHSEVTQYATGLTARDAHGYSFHDLVGEWFGITPATGLVIDEPALKETSLETLDSQRREIQDILERAHAVDLQSHPWRSCIGIELTAFLSAADDVVPCRHVALRERGARSRQFCRPGDSPVCTSCALDVQSSAREALAVELEKLLAGADAAVLSHWRVAMRNRSGPPKRSSMKLRANRDFSQR